MGCDCSMCQNLSTWVVFWMNLVQILQCHKKVASERKVAGNIWSMFNAKGLQLECARVLHEALLMPVLIFGSETMI